MSGTCFLVTGSEGCLGSWAVKRLVERGERCVALDLTSEAARLRKLLPEERIRGVTFVRGDVLEDGLLERLIEEHGVTHIVHLAALQIPLVAADPVRGAAVNVVGTVRVLEAARRQRGRVRGVVYASSAAVFGPDGRPCPATLYGAFKRCNEETARVFWETEGLASVGLRPWAVFGPGRDQGLTAAPTHAMKAVALGLPYHIPFGGRVDLQYARDVADAFIAAAVADARAAVVLNLRGSVISIDELVALVEDVWPGARGLVTHGDDPIPIEADLEADGLRELLGDLPATDVRVSVRETLEHFAALARAGLLDEGELSAA